MPHTGYADIDVDALYEELDSEIVNARAAGFCVIVAGDMNAQVVPQGEYDDPSLIGTNPTRILNKKSDHLLQWCTLPDLVIANTFNESCL